MRKRKPTLALVLVVAAIFSAVQVRAATREDVLGRGYLQCGVSSGLPGFSLSDDNGNWSGFDVDLCRAVAAATLGDATKVRFVPLTVRESFTALQAGEVDLLSHDTGWTITRDTSLGVRFVAASFHDDQGFMAKPELATGDVGNLEGAAVCVQAGSTMELNLGDYFRKMGLTAKAVVLETPGQALKAFESGRCGVLAGNLAHLHGLRSRLAVPEGGAILPEVVARETVGPVVRQGDDAWFNIVRWTLFALINGEALGITSANAGQMSASPDPEIRRFLGLEGIKGQGLGLADDWSLQVVRQVGNYGEIFERNLGNHPLLKLARGRNALWLQGGLQYAPPFR